MNLISFAEFAFQQGMPVIPKVGNKGATGKE
jgi:hypothetical protein